MWHQTVWLLLLICVSQWEGVHSDLSNLDEKTKEEIFDIYTKTALIERAFLNVPVTPDEVKFFLFTKDNPESFTQIDPADPKELNNNKAKFVFFIHGWQEYRERQWYEDLKNSFLKRDDSYYVIQVDWKKLAGQGYLLSAYTTKDVGNIIGSFIVDLNKKFSIPLANFLVVGHSLGGQVAGFIGKKVQELAKEKLTRIVALDPAGPAFIHRPENERLNPNDAQVVHTIHTNGGTFGFEKPCGTIDFFVNGGSVQPGCKKINLTEPITDISQFGDIVFCDHQRSCKYFAEAVAEPKEFLASKCLDWETYTKDLCLLGEKEALGDLESKLTGKFYVRTGGEPPYYKVKNPILPDIKI